MTVEEALKPRSTPPECFPTPESLIVDDVLGVEVGRDEPPMIGNGEVLSKVVTEIAYVNHDKGKPSQVTKRGTYSKGVGYLVFDRGEFPDGFWVYLMDADNGTHYVREDDREKVLSEEVIRLRAENERMKNVISFFEGLPD